MPFIREFQRLLLAFLVGLLLILSAAIYWGVVESSGLRLREDNPRAFEDRAAVQRGSLYDRDGRLLVESTATNSLSTRLNRRYLYPEMFGVLGYYSLTFGAGGVESAYDALLNSNLTPETFSDYFENEVLHQPYRGSDVQLTLDLDVQQRVYEAMQGYQGALVVMQAASGDVMATVSQPTFDPNKLDATWAALVEEENDPLFNRAFQAGYQPGAALQTVLMTVNLIADRPIDEVLEAVDTPVTVNGVTLTCGDIPPASRLTMAEAFAYACPAPFAQLYETIGAERFQEMFALFQLENPPQVAGFPLPRAQSINGDFTLEDALGQGELTVTVAQMASLTAAIVNGGNAPQPNMIFATRPPENTQWQPVREVRSSLPITTTEVSRQVQALMRESVIYGTARRAARGDIIIGGHASLARAGDNTLSWFIGFAVTGANDGVAVAVVLENVDDPTLAAEIGGIALQAAYEQTVSLSSAN